MKFFYLFLIVTLSQDLWSTTPQEALEHSLKHQRDQEVLEWKKSNQNQPLETESELVVRSQVGPYFEVHRVSQSLVQKVYPKIEGLVKCTGRDRQCSLLSLELVHFEELSSTEFPL